ncbi:MAG: hypothetical protein E7588_05470 [Ruminococcaceae bacterium]|nr:hypothetical protein [Oscillospiraceae bacterium]
MKKSKKTALGGIITALCVVILFLGSFFSTLDLSMSALAGMLLVLAVVEMGDNWAWGIFACASVVSILVIPSKLVVCFFVCFMGWYPIAKRSFERLHPVLAWCVKISTFNVFLTVAIWAVNFVFKLSVSDFSFSWALYGLGNVTFVLYDIALSKIILLYLVKLRNILKINKLL